MRKAKEIKPVDPQRVAETKGAEEAQAEASRRTMAFRFKRMMARKTMGFRYK